MTSTGREERLAKNEAMFRAANERMADWEEQHSDDEPELYLCECADPDCRERLALSRSEYERVRANSRHFLVLEGHVFPDIETVVGRVGSGLVVEKPPEVDATIDPLDPRQS